jgi:pimeloyl-ACP methyl ester carboxylesterase
MVPPENGRALAAAIPGAELRLLDDAAHLYTTDEPSVDDDILRFLAAHDGDAVRSRSRSGSATRR